MQITAEAAANEIRRVFNKLAAGTADYLMSVAELATATTLTTSEMQAGALHLIKTDPKVWIFPESNQKVLLPEERIYALQIGGQRKHWITWTR
ncbi:hypothetical protein ACIA7R_31275 [Micromonospora chalcea]